MPADPPPADGAQAAAARPPPTTTPAPAPEPGSPLSSKLSSQSSHASDRSSVTPSDDDAAGDSDVEVEDPRPAPPAPPSTISLGKRRRSSMADDAAGSSPKYRTTRSASASHPPSARSASVVASLASFRPRRGSKSTTASRRSSRAGGEDESDGGAAGSDEEPEDGGSETSFASSAARASANNNSITAASTPSTSTRRRSSAATTGRGAVPPPASGAKPKRPLKGRAATLAAARIAREEAARREEAESGGTTSPVAGALDESAAEARGGEGQSKRKAAELGPAESADSPTLGTLLAAKLGTQQSASLTSSSSLAADEVEDEDATSSQAPVEGAARAERRTVARKDYADDDGDDELGEDDGTAEEDKAMDAGDQAGGLVGPALLLGGASITDGVPMDVDSEAGTDVDPPSSLAHTAAAATVAVDPGSPESLLSVPPSPAPTRGTGKRGRGGRGRGRGRGGGPSGLQSGVTTARTSPEQENSPAPSAVSEQGTATASAGASGQDAGLQPVASGSGTSAAAKLQRNKKAAEARALKRARDAERAAELDAELRDLEQLRKSVADENAPYFIELKEELEYRRLGGIDILEQRQATARENIEKVRQADIEGIWTWWQDARDKLAREQCYDTCSKMSRLSRDYQKLLVAQLPPQERVGHVPIHLGGGDRHAPNPRYPTTALYPGDARLQRKLRATVPGVDSSVRWATESDVEDDLAKLGIGRAAKEKKARREADRAARKEAERADRQRREGEARALEHQHQQQRAREEHADRLRAQQGFMDASAAVDLKSVRQNPAEFRTMAGAGSADAYRPPKHEKAAPLFPTFFGQYDVPPPQAAQGASLPPVPPGMPLHHHHHHHHRQHHQAREQGGSSTAQHRHRSSAVGAQQVPAYPQGVSIAGPPLSTWLPPEWQHQSGIGNSPLPPGPPHALIGIPGALDARPPAGQNPGKNVRPFVGGGETMASSGTAPQQQQRPHHHHIVPHHHHPAAAAQPHAYPHAHHSHHHHHPVHLPPDAHAWSGANGAPPPPPMPQVASTRPVLPPPGALASGAGAQALGSFSPAQQVVPSKPVPST